MGSYFFSSRSPAKATVEKLTKTKRQQPLAIVLKIVIRGKFGVQTFFGLLQSIDFSLNVKNPIFNPIIFTSEKDFRMNKWESKKKMPSLFRLYVIIERKKAGEIEAFHHVLDCFFRVASLLWHVKRKSFSREFIVNNKSFAIKMSWIGFLKLQVFRLKIPE